MIARTASLTLLAKDFDKTRTAIEQVVRRHHGYSGELTVGSETGSARTLSATFKVPAGELDAAIAEIKQLARVERETLGGEEVTDQYVDLSARLSNAHRTEQTLLDILEKRTGKLADVLAVEEELARVREEIERMQAELKNLQNRVTFATLQVEMREEYKAALEIPPSVGRRLKNALVEGLRTAADSVLGVAFFFMSSGPVLLLWILILFWPVRFLVRRVRAALAKK
jgi:chromosome segregation ATPase